MREFTLVPVRRPKNMVSVRLAPKTDGNIFKCQATWILEALGAYYSHRAGYCLSPKKAEYFTKLHTNGWSASFKLLVVDKRPHTFSPKDSDEKYTLKEAINLIDKEQKTK